MLEATVLDEIAFFDPGGMIRRRIALPGGANTADYLGKDKDILCFGLRKESLGIGFKQGHRVKGPLVG